jgi:hypothetical protein
VLDSGRDLPAWRQPRSPTQDSKSATMTRQIPSSMVTVTLSTRRAVLPPRIVHQVATLAAADGLDIDATTTLGRWLAARLAASKDANIPVRTIWLPAGEIRSSVSRRLIETIADRQPDARLSVVAVLPGGASFHELTAHLALSPAQAADTLPLVLGLPISCNSVALGDLLKNGTSQ